MYSSIPASATVDDARRIFTSLYGSDIGFEAQFSPGTDLETMDATEFMQRLQVAEPFNVTEHLQASSVYNRRLIDTFNRMEEQCLMNTVDNGEFELSCAKEVRKCLEMEDDISPNRPPALVLERCRRGGKTFMLCAVAKMLAESLEKQKPRSTRKHHIVAQRLLTTPATLAWPISLPIKQRIFMNFGRCIRTLIQSAHGSSIQMCG
jgi:hypothetical protein